MLTGSFVALTLGWGALYSFASFADPLAREFGASHAELSWTFGLAGLAAFSVGALTGPVSDRLGCRLPVLCGMALVALGLALAARAETLVQLLLCYGLLVGIGVGCVQVPAMAAVQRAFAARRGLTSGVAAAGIGIGIAAVPPLTEAALRVGTWREAFTAGALVVAGLGTVVALLIAPARKRAGPDADRGRSPGRAEPLGRILRQVVWSAAFARLYVGCLMVSVPAALPFAHLVVFAEGVGLDRPSALGLLTLIGLGSIGGRFVLGGLADSWGRRRCFLGCCLGIGGSMLGWALAGGPQSLTVFALLFGALHGGFNALLPAFVADLHGCRGLGGILGILLTGRGVAMLFGPPVAALLADSAGAWLPLLGAGLLGAAGAVLLGRVR